MDLDICTDEQILDRYKEISEEMKKRNIKLSSVNLIEKFEDAVREMKEEEVDLPSDFKLYYQVEERKDRYGHIMKFTPFLSEEQCEKSIEDHSFFTDDNVYVNHDHPDEPPQFENVGSEGKYYHHVRCYKRTSETKREIYFWEATCDRDSEFLVYLDE